jgi:hypothetical protein
MLEPYPELEIGGQSAKTLAGHASAVAFFIIKYRQKVIKDMREFDQYSENELCDASMFRRFGFYLVNEAKMANGEWYAKDTLEQAMIRLKGVIYRRFRNNLIWTIWQGVILAALRGVLKKCPL